MSREPTWEFDTSHILGPASSFPMLWHDLNKSRELEHLSYDDLEYDEQMAAWLISAAIANRIPFEMQARLCLDGAWLTGIERAKQSIVALVGVDYRESAWFAGRAIALEQLAKHCGHRFPGNSNHALEPRS